MKHSVELQSPANLLVIIRGEDTSWSLRPRELWEHRDLLYFLTWRDIKVRYKQTGLGILWTVIQPLAIALTLFLFLGRVVKAPSDGLPYLVFAYSAMVIWQFFASAVTGSSNSVVANERLITKIYFPHLIVPLSAVAASLFDFVISLPVLAAFLIYFRILPGFSLLALPLIVLLAVLNALGVGLWLSALNVKYRDVRHTVGFLVQFWFLATPVAYSAGLVPAKWRVLYGLNPMVGVVEGFRWALRGTDPAPVALIATSVCVAALLTASGLYYFQKIEDTFADYI